MAADQQNADSQCGLQLPDKLIKILKEDSLGCNRISITDDKELWLIQLPIDFPLEDDTTWSVEEVDGDKFAATCTADGTTFRMIEEADLGAEPVFAVGNPEDGVTAVARRVVIYRETNASELCFGVKDPNELLEDVKLERLASPVTKPAKKSKVAATSEAGKMEFKEEKRKKRKGADEKIDGKSKKKSKKDKKG